METQRKGQGNAVERRWKGQANALARQWKGSGKIRKTQWKGQENAVAMQTMKQSVGLVRPPIIPAAAQAKASVFNRTAAETQGTAAPLSLTGDVVQSDGQGDGAVVLRHAGPCWDELAH